MAIFFSMFAGWWAIFVVVAIVLGIIGIILTFTQNRITGWAGEQWTRERLDKLPKEQYIVLNDIMIETKGRTHQIDHVVVSPHGIFSIETKKYSGYLRGSKYDKNWIRYNWGRKYFYENPIRQNMGHVKALAELLNMDESKIFNLVCIPSDAHLDIKHDGELTRYDTLLERIVSHNQIIINNPNEIANIIISNNIIDEKIRREHVRRINETVIKNDQTKCPRCGGQLVYRDGKYGRFIGCINYPRCKYTENKK